jgi:hypothetical protein
MGDKSGAMTSDMIPTGKTFGAGALLADGFAEAFVGMGHRFTYDVAVYDRQKCLDILIARDGMTYEEAQDYFCVNVEGAFMGEHTPVFLEKPPRQKTQAGLSAFPTPTHRGRG